MAHTEQLGTKTIYLTIDPAEVERQEDGSGIYETMNGTTPMRTVLTPEVMTQMPDTVSCLTLTGQAELHIAIGEDCSVDGYEEIIASEISVLAYSAGTRVAPIELPY